MIPDHIVIHHSLTNDGTTVSWGAIREYHLSLGWLDIGYHFGCELIGSNYEILLGRLPNQMGAHCKQHGMNQRAIGICLVGNFDLVSPPDAQIDPVISLVQYLMGVYSIPAENVKRHSDFANKSCPGKLFPWQEFISQL